MANYKSGKRFLNFINTRNNRKHGNYELDDIEEIFSPASADGKIEEQTCVLCLCLSCVCVRHSKGASYLKVFCDRGYNNWSETEFKEQMRVGRETF